ncbi:MAG: alpha/beta hydrolase [Pseudomonadota bacterium]
MRKSPIAIALCALFSVFLVTCGPPGSGKDYMQVGLIEERRVLANGSEIRTLERWPDVAPQALVLFIHGTPGSADGWVDMLAQTPDDLAAVAYDRPGYGESRPKAAVTSLKSQANTAIAVAEQARGDRPIPIIIVGHSLGGPIAATAALAAPKSIKTAVLVAASLDPDLEKIHWAQRLATIQPIKFLIGRTLRNANAELMSLEAELIDLEQELGDTQVPIFIIHGTEDELVPIENVDYMKKKYEPAMVCQTEIIEGQNHFLPWNEMDRLWRMIQAAARTDTVSC